MQNKTRTQINTKEWKVLTSGVFLPSKHTVSWIVKDCALCALFIVKMAKQLLCFISKSDQLGYFLLFFDSSEFAKTIDRTSDCLSCSLFIRIYILRLIFILAWVTVNDLCICNIMLFCELYNLNDTNFCKINRCWYMILFYEKKERKTQDEGIEIREDNRQCALTKSHQLNFNATKFIGLCYSKLENYTQFIVSLSLVDNFIWLRARMLYHHQPFKQNIYCSKF